MRDLNRKLHWWRFFQAAIWAELIPLATLFAIVYYYTAFLNPGLTEAEINQYAAMVGSWVGPIGGGLMALVFAYWAGSKLSSRFIIHGALIGALLALIDASILAFLAEPFSWLYVASNLLKIVMGTLGGFIAQVHYNIQLAYHSFLEKEINLNQPNLAFQRSFFYC